jgi:hypothetical protein
MTIVQQKWSAPPTPLAVEAPERLRAERSYEPDLGGNATEVLVASLQKVNRNPLGQPVAETEL